MEGVMWMNSKLAPVLALALVLLPACGDSTSTSTGQQSTTESAAPAPVSLQGAVNDHGQQDLSGTQAVDLNMQIGDSFFAPTYIKVDAGATVTVHLQNDGALEHTFTIDSLSVEQTLAPAAEADISFTMPDNAVQFFCRFHVSMGMQGAAYSEAGQDVTS